jgi:hypothetical protein
MEMKDDINNQRKILELKNKENFHQNQNAVKKDEEPRTKTPVINNREQPKYSVDPRILINPNNYLKPQGQAAPSNHYNYNYNNYQRPPSGQPQPHPNNANYGNHGGNNDNQNRNVIIPVKK